MTKKDKIKFVEEAPLVQGDVILKRVESLPEGLPLEKVTLTDKEIQEGKGLILQMSEVTGHHHHFQGNAAVDLFAFSGDSSFWGEDEEAHTTITPNEGKFIVVKGDGAVLYHGKGFDENPHAKGRGDHKALNVPPGTYYIDITREYNYDKMETRRVVD